jgi:diguanylate cyclase (GGDEF)-like protein/PAS domain S-box-containing protein
LELTDERRGRLVVAACLFAAFSGVLCMVIGAAVWGARDHELWLLVAFGVALTAIELFPLKLTHSGQSEALRLEEAFFVPMIFLLGPVETMSVIAIALGVASAFSRRRALMKGLFNVGMITTSAAIGLVTAHVIGLDSQLGGRDIVAAVAGGFVFCAVSAVSVSGIIALSTAQSFRMILLDGFAVRIATWIGSLSLGVLVLVATEQQRWALVAAAVPVVVLQFAFSGAMRQWRERQQAEALYEAAGRIRASVDSSDVRAELVDAAGQLLGAGTARVVHDLSAEPAEGFLRIPLDEKAAVEVGERATGGAWTRGDASRLQALAAVASGALANALLYEQLQAITRSLGEGVLALDAAGRITFVNPAGARLLAWRSDELQGRHIADAIDPAGRLTHPDGATDWVHLPRLRAGETLRIDEYTVTRSDGSVLDVALTASPVLRDEEVVGAVIALRDVTERKALERRLMHQAFHDQLTGLPNRALFLDRLEHAQARARENGNSQAVLFVDLDRFKLINDSLGHRAGDDVLCTVGSRIVGALGFGDTVARFGGDEFTVLLEQVTDRAEAAETAERILTALSLPINAGDRSVVISASIGIAIADSGDAPHDLLAAADIAMYEAKSAGGARHAIAASDADGVARAKLDLEMELRRAIEHGELELEYQPVVRAHGEALYGFEALVRWRHPRLGMLPPSHFMPLAEEGGLIIPLGDWVLEEACRTAKRWAEEHPGSGTVMAVNLSARQFQHPDLCARVRDVIDRVGLDPALLTLEITETVVMENSAHTLETLTALRALGVRLAIDDFGTGYSSLSYLKRFPVDVVKIDKSFVDGLASDTVDREIVAAVIRLASACGMQTVAEGVETAAQLDQLRLLGCSLVQGFLIARPEPVSTLARRLGRAASTGMPVPRASADDLVPAMSGMVYLAE